MSRTRDKPPPVTTMTMAVAAAATTVCLIRFSKRLHGDSSRDFGSLEFPCQTRISEIPRKFRKVEKETCFVQVLPCVCEILGDLG